jgi:pyruvate dehydrogenase E2 component (dihydrolipoamide acetyltransferase)
MGTVTMPKMGDTMEEGTIVKWLKQEGDDVSEGDVIAEIETEKAAIEIEAFESGPLTKILVQEGETVPVGEPIAQIGGGGAPSTKKAEAPAPKAEEPPKAEKAEKPSPQEAPPAEAEPRPAEPAPAGDDHRVKASPLARRIALANNVNLQEVRGTGPGGRIVKEDVESFMAGAPPREQAPAPQRTPAPARTAAAPAPTGDVWTEGKPPSRMRQVIARRMAESKQAVPHFYVTMDVDVKAMMALREQLNTRGEEFVKLSPNDLVIKAVADALRAQPAMRKAWRGDGPLVTERVNVGVAVALEDGLIVPVIRDTDSKSLNTIAQEVRALAEKARAGKLLPDEYAGGTFTVTNMGMFGVEDFGAIINPPEPGILAVGVVEQRPVVEDGQLAVGTRMKFTLSADHRAVDGAVGAQFVQEVKRRLENPLLLVQ